MVNWLNFQWCKGGVIMEAGLNSYAHKTIKFAVTSINYDAFDINYDANGRN